MTNETNTTIRIQSSRFGELQVESSRVLEFICPVIGFEDIKNYTLLEHEEDSPFLWLHAMEDPDLAFVLTNPSYFGIPFEFEIPTEEANKLGLKTADEVRIFTVVTVPDEAPNKLTANFKAPIVINTTNNKAMQFVIPQDNYPIKVRLIPDEEPSTSPVG